MYLEEEEKEQRKRNKGVFVHLSNGKMCLKDYDEHASTEMREYIEGTKGAWGWYIIRTQVHILMTFSKSFFLNVLRCYVLFLPPLKKSFNAKCLS